jgi:probable phosphoglycerate mutase
VTASTVVLWRHGRTAFNAEGRLQGQVDIELDDVGRWQAERAAVLLAAQHRPVRVVTSDLGRARSTAQRLADLAGAGLEVDPRLRERSFGEWEGLSAGEIAERWPEAYAVWRSGHDPERVGAETRVAVAGRMTAAVTGLADEMAGGTLVCVSHGAAITLGLTGLLELDPSAWRGMVGLHNAHWAVLHASSGDARPAWRLGGHNLGPSVHLDDWNAGVPGEGVPSSTADAMRP